MNTTNLMKPHKQPRAVPCRRFRAGARGRILLAPRRHPRWRLPASRHSRAPARRPRTIEVRGALTGEQAQILCPGALDFLAELHREFNPRRQQLLEARRLRQAAIDAGELPGFLPETRAIREGAWQVLSVPEDLQDRRVEITGPVERKLVINALNSGANCYMADFEDAHSPVWQATLEGQINVRDAVRGTIACVSGEGKRYQLNAQVATLLVRPRGWHLDEPHVRVDGEAVSAGLFDFALYVFHNARYRATHDSGTYLYLPKLQHYLEARLWNDIFVRTQDRLGLPQGTIKATVLIEHILAAFQMEEILYEMRHHSAGLNCGRWDYLFSYIKTFARRPGFVVPDRAQVTMTAPLMRAYTLGCIEACHKRGAFAIGGMSAYIPVKADGAANARALQKVQEDKRREATDGHDGTWVAHPGLVAVAREEFDRVLGTRPNQIERRQEELTLSVERLLQPPAGTITEVGLRTNIRVGIEYLEAWLRGSGCVPLENLMEDAATAEISRSQVWQWINDAEGVLEDGRRVTVALVRQLIQDEVAGMLQRHGAERFQSGCFVQAVELFDELVTSHELAEFLTLKAYPFLEPESKPAESLPRRPIARPRKRLAETRRRPRAAAFAAALD